MNTRCRCGTLVAAGVLVVSGLGPARAMEVVERPEATIRTITVAGQGEVKRKPDLVTLSLGVTAKDVDISKARQYAAAKMQTALQALQRAGVKRGEIETSEFSVYRVFDTTRGPLTRKGKPAGQWIYKVSNTLAVRTGLVAKAGQIIDAAVRAGINEIDGPNFELKDDAQAQRDALEAAYKDAELRAQRLARTADLRITRPLGIREAGAEEPVVYKMKQMRAPMEVPAMPPGVAYYETSVRSGMISVSAGVSVAFEVE